MQKLKEKICECGLLFTQYNSLTKYCSTTCEKKYKLPPGGTIKKIRVAQVSRKQAELNKIYRKLRLEFLLKPENQFCPVTKQPATDIHHMYAGSNRSTYFLDTTTWLAVSRIGHIWIHDNSEKAKELGFLK